MSITGLEQVIVYDQSPFFQKLIENMLHVFHIPKVICCADLKEVRSLITDSEVDCVIMDWEMDSDKPMNLVRDIRRGMDGINLETPLVMCTAHAQVERIFAARDAGIDEILAKPISPEHLLNKMLAARFQRRPFIESSSYRGPCRRRKDLPITFEDRRGSETDLSELF